MSTNSGTYYVVSVKVNFRIFIGFQNHFKNLISYNLLNLRNYRYIRNYLAETLNDVRSNIG